MRNKKVMSMAHCDVCGQEMTEKQIKCKNCGEVYIRKREEDIHQNGLLYVMFGLLLPPIGLIMFFLWREKRSPEATDTLKGVLLAIPVYIVAAFFAWFILPSLMAGMYFTPSTKKSAVYADALAMEQAVDLYCGYYMCNEGEVFTLDDLDDYVEGMNWDYYDVELDSVVAIIADGETLIYLEAEGTGNWEFTRGTNPGGTTRDDSVFRDTN